MWGSVKLLGDRDAFTVSPRRKIFRRTNYLVHNKKTNKLQPNVPVPHPALWNVEENKKNHQKKSLHKGQDQFLLKKNKNGLWVRK
jgi:hypothetical protein